MRHETIAPQFGDVVLQRTLNARRNRRQPVVQPVGSLGEVAAHVDVTVETPGGHLMTVDRRGAENRRFAPLTGCSQATKPASSLIGSRLRHGSPDSHR
jgi:hypothetical protein